MLSYVILCYHSAGYLFEMPIKREANYGKLSRAPVTSPTDDQIDPSKSLRMETRVRTSLLPVKAFSKW